MVFKKVSSLLFLLNHFFILRGVEVRVMVLICCLLLFRIFNVILGLYVCVSVCACVSSFGKTKDGFPCLPWKKVTYD